MSLRQFRPVFVFSLACLLPSVASAQTTWHVDDDGPCDPGPGDPAISDPLEDGSAAFPFDAIQEAINAATDGDEVLVADGIYTGIGNKDLDFSDGLPAGQTRAITVRSENGAVSCIIDCENSGRGFYLHSGEGPAAVVDGFTITNGWVDWMGSENGGGIFCAYSSPTIKNCIITGNTAYGMGFGGGIYCGAGSPSITNCTITGNTAGGMTIGFGAGGGICCTGSSTITSCTITDNLAFGEVGLGGGISCASDNSAATIISCIIANNTASSAVEYVDGGGGGIHYFGSPTITGCTIISNTADGGGSIGGGILGEFGNPTITSSILRSNSPEQVYVMSGSPVITYTNIAFGWAGEGNINANPNFVGDYRLQSNSPCINAGDPDFTAGPDDSDIDGQPRVQQCRIDMGADETPHFATDCDTNGISDECDIVEGMSLDCDADGIPDDCEYPGCWGILPGDMNCDGMADGADIQRFTDHLVAEQYTCQADMNQDGFANGDDIQPFVLLVMSP